MGEMRQRCTAAANMPGGTRKRSGGGKIALPSSPSGCPFAAIVTVATGVKCLAYVEGLEGFLGSRRD